MVMMAEPIVAAVEAADPPRPLLYLSPAGRRLDQAAVRGLAELDGFSLLCGRYEGVDERVREHVIDGELSIGRSEEHTSELQSLMRISYAVFCLKKKKTNNTNTKTNKTNKTHTNSKN